MILNRYRFKINLSWTGVEPSSLRYLWPLILRYCSIISSIIVNWVKMRTRSSLSFIEGSTSSRIANFPLSQIWWLPKLKCSIHWKWIDVAFQDHVGTLTASFVFITLFLMGHSRRGFSLFFVFFYTPSQQINAVPIKLPITCIWTWVIWCKK